MLNRAIRTPHRLLQTQKNLNHLLLHPKASSNQTNPPPRLTAARSPTRTTSSVAVHLCQPHRRRRGIHSLPSSGSSQNSTNQVRRSTSASTSQGRRNAPPARLAPLFLFVARGFLSSEATWRSEPRILHRRESN